MAKNSPKSGSASVKTGQPPAQKTSQDSKTVRGVPVLKNSPKSGSASAKPSQPPAQKTSQESESSRGVPVFRPVTDIREHKDGVTILVEMPGVGPDDVDIELERRVLTIRGRGRTISPDGYRRTYAEYDEGDYERSFTISEGLDAGKVKASMKNGLLILELPPAEAVKPKQIKVSAA